MIYLADYLGGMLVGALTALGVRTVVCPGMDMVIAMLLGMAVGTVIHFVLGFALSPLLGMFHAMVPASLIGMYGGMLFGMRDSMAAGSRTAGATMLVGAVFGAAVILLVHVYDRALKGPVVDAGA